MTLAEYLDSARFPLTTQAGLTPRQQMMMDAFNLDAIREAVEEEGAVLTAEEQARYAELQEKAKHRTRLLEELNMK
jgi:hypothetical protein